MLITKSSEVGQVLEFIASNPIIALDIETDSLNPRTGKIIGFGISTAKNSYYLAGLSWNGAALVEVLPQSCLIEVLRALQGKRLITFNGAFDLPFIKHFYGVDLLDNLHSDPMLAAHLSDENRYTYGLKDLSADIFGADVKAEQAAMKASIAANGGAAGEFYKAELKLMAEYCEQDCRLTFKLHDHFMKLLDDEELTGFYYDETMPLYREVVIPMEQHGIRLDMPLLLQSQKEIEADLAAIEKSIQAAIKPYLGLWRQWLLQKDYPPARTGAFAQAYVQLNRLPLPRTKAGSYSMSAKAIDNLPPSHAKQVLQQAAYMTPQEVSAVQEMMYAADGSPPFNLLSTHHLKKLFFDTLKENPLSRTPTGQPQVDDAFLEEMAKKYTWCFDLQNYRHLVKIKGTYIDRFIEAAENGRFYPRYKQHGTTSGRLSGDFQQLPRPLEPDDAIDVIVKHTNRIRAFFIADEGHIFVDDDYNSAEPRIFAHISDEDGIREIFSKGEDFYSKIALLVEGLPQYSADKKAPNYLGKVAKSKRQSAKVYALGIPYSMTGYKLQFELDIPLEQAEALVRKYLDAFPKLAAWMHETLRIVCSTGRVRIESGRIRHLARAKNLYMKYGDPLLDDLELWKALNHIPALYEAAKAARREFKNLIANGTNVQIQGLVASMMNRSCIAIAREFKAQKLPAVIVAQLHDQVVVHCPEAIKEQVGAIVQDKMENTMKFSVPMVAVPSYGYNLRDSKGD